MPERHGQALQPDAQGGRRSASEAALDGLGTTGQLGERGFGVRPFKSKVSVAVEGADGRREGGRFAR
jgi:hypothetical protein